MPKTRARPDPSWITLRRALFAFGVVLVGINVVSSLWTLRSDRIRVERDALRNFANLTALLAEQTARSFESVNLLLDAATSDMAATGIGDLAARETRLKDRLSGIPQVRSLLLLGPDGRVLVDTAGDIPAGLDMSDRIYFVAQRDGNASGRFVSGPFQGRASGHWEFAVSGRLSEKAGGFAGVLAAKMDVAYFEHLYRTLDVGPDGFVELATNDGQVITRVPGARAASALPGAESDGVLAALKRDGRFTGWSGNDAQAGADPVLISAAAIPALPLNVAVGAPERAVLAPWRAEAVRIGLRTLLTSAAMLALVLLAARELARRAAADERVRQSEQRYALAMDASEEGHFDWSLQTDMLFASAKMSALFGLPAEAKHAYRREFVKHISYPPGEREPLHASLEAVIKSSALRHEFEHRIVAKSGEIRWLRARWKIQRDERGRAARIVGVVTDVTTEKLAESELRARQEMLDLAQQAAKAAAFEWRIDTGRAGWSPELEPMHGLAPGTYDGTYETWKKLVHPQDWPAVSAAIERAKETSDYAVEYRVVHPGGSVHWLQARGRLLGAADGASSRMVGFVLDVTDRRQAEAELQRQTVLLDELIASAPEAIIMYDADWCVVRVNREFTRMFGYTPEETVGADVARRLVPDERAAEFQDARHRLSRGEHLSIETVCKRKDGSLFHVSVLGAPIWVGGERIGAFVIFRDITEGKLAEAEQARLQSRLRQAEKMEAVGRLAGGIAHDFNNILGGILGYGEMVFEEAAEGTPMKRYARNVLAGANRARDLVDQILTYSRSQRAKRVPVEIDRIISETLELVRGSLPAGITLDLALPAAPLVVIGDPTQLHQIVMNLCTNAIHAMRGAGTLHVALAPADISAERVLAHGTLAPGRYVQLTVADTGSGMDAATLARVFEPFFTTKEVGRGTGLGLSLVYGIVTDSGGAIHVASELGRGSTFEIYLPRVEARASVAEAAGGPVPRGNGERVLLVDDEEPLTVMTAEVLAQLGYEAAPFTDGRAALAAFEETPEAFQVVVTDEVMPALTGTELARRVRRLRPDLPIVLVSGYSGPILTQQALGAGVSELLKKPVQSRELAAALARVLRRAA